MRGLAPAAEPSADHCIVDGTGIKVGTTGVESTFSITAVDASGHKLETGGHHFFVLVRGPDKVRAKVVDHGNGTYTVTWKTWTSGSYKIIVSLLGKVVRGSPWELFVFHPHSHAPNCEVRGQALQHAAARSAAEFAIKFKDKLGQTAYAADLDVFVELIKAAPHPSQPIMHSPSQTRLLQTHAQTHEDEADTPVWTPVARAVSFPVLTPSASTPGSGRSRQEVGGSPHPQFHAQLVGAPRTKTHSERFLPRTKKLLWDLQKLNDMNGYGSGGTAETLSYSEPAESGELSEEPLPNGSAALSRTTAEEKPTGSNGLDESSLSPASFSPSGASNVSLPASPGRARLDVTSRRLQRQLWTRRDILDSVHVDHTSDKGVVFSRGVWGFRETSAYLHELDVDPVGFAFGGVYPGILHAHGKLFEEHKAREQPNPRPHPYPQPLLEHHPHRMRSMRHESILALTLAHTYNLNLTLCITSPLLLMRLLVRYATRLVSLARSSCTSACATRGCPCQARLLICTSSLALPMAMLPSSRPPSRLWRGRCFAAFCAHATSWAMHARQVAPVSKSVRAPRSRST